MTSKPDLPQSLPVFLLPCLDVSARSRVSLVEPRDRRRELFGGRSRRIRLSDVRIDGHAPLTCRRLARPMPTQRSAHPAPAARPPARPAACSSAAARAPATSSAPFPPPRARTPDSTEIGSSGCPGPTQRAASGPRPTACSVMAIAGAGRNARARFDPPDHSDAGTAPHRRRPSAPVGLRNGRKMGWRPSTATSVTVRSPGLGDVGIDPTAVPTVSASVSRSMSGPSDTSTRPPSRR